MELLPNEVVEEGEGERSKRSQSLSLEANLGASVPRKARTMTHMLFISIFMRIKPPLAEKELADTRPM